MYEPAEKLKIIVRKALYYSGFLNPFLLASATERHQLENKVKKQAEVMDGLYLPLVHHAAAMSR